MVAKRSIRDPGVITIIESRAAKTLGECTRGAHSGLPFYRVDGPLQTMKITGTPE